MNRRNITRRIAAATLQTTRIALVVVVALMSFFPLGAYLPGKKRNPAAKNGLPTLVLKEKKKARQDQVARTELDR